MARSHPRPKSIDVEPAAESIRRPRWLLIAIAALVVSATLALASDWWACLPEEATATYVGRDACADCHQAEAAQYTDSHHDRAMDRATADTVLGNFDNATLEHFGVTSRMYREGDRFMVETEGADGRLASFTVSYVFGVEPLQQYLVEFDRPDTLGQNEVSRLQVLPVCWDTANKKWFFLTPPDVRHEKIEPHDVLFWTNRAQNWNYMCADCHSTNIQKRYDAQPDSFHASFSEIDVSCEACHGPGSLHVDLARRRSLFWDRKRGYALAKLKDEDSEVEIATCAECHSRRRIVTPGHQPGDSYFDHFACNLLTPELYHADGQILDEVYVHGSFLQSKMYAKGIRCTDCHNPHTARLKFEGNKVCTSCHQHSAAKYDSFAHHRHALGSTGAMCVECHMPETTYMEVDPRRDHSLRVPRPDLSVQLGTPNACTGCHIDPNRIEPGRRAELRQYADWLVAAKGGDDEIAAELDRVNRWADEQVQQWYGDKQRERHFSQVLHAAWEGRPESAGPLIELAVDRKQPAIVRASALIQLPQFEGDAVDAALRGALQDPEPQLRYHAVVALESLVTGPANAARELQQQMETLEYVLSVQQQQQPPQMLDRIRQQLSALHSRMVQVEQRLLPAVRLLGPLLKDPEQVVRIEAARVLAAVPHGVLDGSQRKARAALFEKFKSGVHDNNYPSAALMTLGIFYERLPHEADSMGDAIFAYQSAIRIEPHVAGPRSNLATIFERIGETEEAAQLKAEELALLARDARQLPSSATLQYRFGLALYLDGQVELAREQMERAVELAPFDPYFLFVLSKLYEQLEDWERAHAGATKLLTLRPDNQMYQLFLQELEQANGVR